MIQAVLADDEVLARQKLRQLLRDEPEIEIVGECASANETVELVRLTKPALLFLDIRMPGMDGFDVVGAIASESVPMPAIVFTTAYDQYALRAFEVHAVDYLLKPFTGERLNSAIQRVRERLAAGENSAPRQRQKPGWEAHIPPGSFSNRAAASCFCRSRRFAGLAPKKITCVSPRSAKRICSAKPWRTLKNDSIRSCFCASIGHSSSIFSSSRKSALSTTASPP